MKGKKRYLIDLIYNIGNINQHICGQLKRETNKVIATISAVGIVRQCWLGKHWIRKKVRFVPD